MREGAQGLPKVEIVTAQSAADWVLLVRWMLAPVAVLPTLVQSAETLWALGVDVKVHGAPAQSAGDQSPNSWSDCRSPG
jgi:hypothetical protein